MTDTRTDLQSDVRVIAAELRQFWDSHGVDSSYKMKWASLDEENIDYRGERLRAFAACFRGALEDLSGLRILDVGCGNGGWLRTLLEIGAEPHLLKGVDVSAARFKDGLKKNPLIHMSLSDGVSLNFEDACFDIVMQNVCFMCISSREIRVSLAAEMLRVLKVGGFIWWFDLPCVGCGEGTQDNGPSRYWPDLEIVSVKAGRLPLPSECLLPGRRRQWLAPLIDRLGYQRMHIAARLGPKR
jgi:SAM-dependent methyltransferase